MTVLIKNQTNSITMYLTNSSGTAVTGLTYATTFVDIRKNEDSFYNKTLTSGNFAELGSGFYTLALTASDCDTLGEMLIRTSGSTIAPYISTATVYTEAPSAPTNSPRPSMSYLFGYLYGVNGSPVEDASVCYKLLATPEHSTGYAATEGLVVEKTDSEGFFLLKVITGTTLDLFISEANYRRSVTVPGGATNLFTIP